MQIRALTIIAAVAVIIAVACKKDDATAPAPVSKLVTFKATLNGASEVPANATTGTGTFTATLDTSNYAFTYDLTFTGLTSNVNNGHIHGPATTTASSGTTINFNTLSGASFSFGATSGTGHGSTVLNAGTQITATMSGDSLRKLLFAGLAYANIHTTQNPGGEIRGQILKQ
ncbi:MAG: CHRD domain-containing protein [Gemmatimonadetes bacterium]|nr:CHRD domain-containing protein [Gemmatimonadota bacterium]